MERFPNDPIFTNLLRLSHSRPGLLIHDEYGIDAGANDLLNDVQRLREALREKLPTDWFDAHGILRPEAGRIASLSASGYYFLVGFFAIAALGGTCVPLATSATSVETLRSLDMAEATYLLTEPNTSDLGGKVKEHAGHIQIIPIERQGEDKKANSTFETRFEIDEDLMIPENRPILVISTSGTSSSQPKGVVAPRRIFFYTIEDLAHPREQHLAYRSVHWMGGVGGLVSRFLRGMRIHWPRRRRDGAMFWEIFKQGGITDVSFPASLFTMLQDYYLNTIRGLPPHEHDAYIRGARNIKVGIVSGSAMHPAAGQFWMDIAGIKLQSVYASTELGGVALACDLGAEYLDRCVGTPEDGVEVKLSDGDYGELLAKSPRMFLYYLNNEAATKAAFDEDGFYKTGDMMRRIGGKYFFEGRKSSDWIQFYYLSIPVLDVEKHLLCLPYISEAYILPVLDRKARGLPAALVRLNCPNPNKSINLARIREDLSKTLEAYKLPALLYILKDEDEVPRSASEKVLKVQALQKFFGIRGLRSADYAVDGVEVCDVTFDVNI
ncbi:hypothetical protein BDV06DRAFT_220464 [Aspergillus oleicola]